MSPSRLPSKITIMNSKKHNLILKVATLSVCLLALALTGCANLSSKESTGVVIARRAQIRSSVAVVAAELLEVSRGDEVDVIETVESQDQTQADSKERWFHVRAHDDRATEGWIEARNILTQDMLEQSKRLSDEDKGIPGQATGQLRASSNLRLTPDYANGENILMKMENGATFEIVGWKRLPKAKTSETIETDDAPKNGSGRSNLRSRNGRAQDDSEKAPEETTDLWYKVRLAPSVSPAPAGWIYGKQVELTVPADIIFYRTGREFVAWQRLDTDSSLDQSARALDSKDAAKEQKPGSWVILEKSSSDTPHTLDEPDFDRIYVVGYDKINQEHYTVYRSPDVKGFLPMKIEGHGDTKTFTIRVLGDGGQSRDVQYGVYRDDRGHLRVNAPGDIPRPKKK
jgi:hypothetical protein